MIDRAKTAVKELRRMRMLREGKCCRECYAHCNAPPRRDCVCAYWCDATVFPPTYVDWRRVRMSQNG
jgi:hypothetical protein